MIAPQFVIDEQNEFNFRARPRRFFLNTMFDNACDTRSSTPSPHAGCPTLPRAIPVPFSSFKNKYAGGRCHVVGRGPTDFDYEALAELDEPVFFINDAISLEKLARSETFFFAHDAELRPWLDGGISSTAVLPLDGTILVGDDLQHHGPAVYYRHRLHDGALLRMSRDQVADRAALFAHSGTIHSLIHFAWFCGFKQMVLIGCDGIDDRSALNRFCGANRGYDRRLQNRSNSTSAGRYNFIRGAQDQLLTFFNIEPIYRGTPILAGPCASSPNRLRWNSMSGALAIPRAR